MASKITPFLWFNNNAEEAINYYVSVFNNAPGSDKSSKINFILKYPEGMSEEVMKGMSGKVINGDFELNGQRFLALDGGPTFKFNESVSFLITCKNQEEVDYFWEKLSHVPESEQCGWVKDKFGLSWQIIPEKLGELLAGSDPDKSRRVASAMLKMKKIIIVDLEKAAENI
jgi:predicted 3-demethylubiquinone-9 3-methyltransferase (glyoxalase superfamily)